MDLLFDTQLGEQVYFIPYTTDTPTIRNTAQVLACISLGFTLMLGLGYLMDCDDPCTPKIMKCVKILSITCCVSTLLDLLTPNKTTLYQMSAVYSGKQINKSVQVDAKIKKISTIMDLQLDKTIKELTQDTK